MLTFLLGNLHADVYHFLLRVMGVDLDGFHDWLDGFCPCGHLNDYDDEVEVS